ncbi:MAG: DUF1501 domain-containing protein [Fimbriiglobus sp.]|nr:DUF1501 domain-containing protein [Fimbriiglobus sp.]
MLTVSSGPAIRNCAGLTRRAALKVGALGFAGLSLPNLLRASDGQSSPKKSVILVWLDGGPSQLETYDPKPDAPAEYRGPFGVCKTATPGVCVSELMPETARRFGKLALLRSVNHGTGDHFAAAHWVTTGRFGATVANKTQQYPSVGSVVAKVKGANAPGLPAYVGLPSAETVYLFPGYMGAAYLGAAYHPFDVNREQQYLGPTDPGPVRTPKWLTGLKGATADGMTERTSLLKQLDTLRRDLDTSGTAALMDEHQQKAIDLILGGSARSAFDFDKEDPKAADRYGRSATARYTMMARRLVEAGVTFVTVDMPHWDDHANIEKAHAMRVPVVDQAVSALIDDLSDRGLLDTTLVVVAGEFGRTPKINTGLPGQPVPGRDHWGSAFSVLMAGGGLRGGVVVGRTSAKAEYPVERPLTPADVLATIYKVMEIDPKQAFKDHTGRPVPLIDDGEAIKELF